MTTTLAQRPPTTPDSVSVPTIGLTVYNVGPRGLRVLGTVDVTERGSRSARRELWRVVTRARRRMWDDEHLAVTVEANQATYGPAKLPDEFGHNGAWRLPEHVIRVVDGFRAGVAS